MLVAANEWNALPGERRVRTARSKSTPKTRRAPTPPPARQVALKESTVKQLNQFEFTLNESVTSIALA